MSYTIPAFEGDLHLENMPDFVVTAADEKLLVEAFGDEAGTDLVFRATYRPDFNQEVRYNLSDIYRGLLSTELQNASVYVQDKVYKRFLFRITGLDSGTVEEGKYAILLSRAEVAETPIAYMQSHYLTLQPVEKNVTKGMPEHLTFNDTGVTVLARFYPLAGGHDDVALPSTVDTGVKTCRFFWESLWEMRQGDCYPYIDIVANDGKGDMMSQRYIYKHQSGHEHYFLWVNAFGGIDTICCDGANALQPQVTHNVGRRQRQVIQLDDTDDHRQWQQQSGWFPWKQREWLWDFVSSKLGHWIYDAEKESYTEIVVTSSEMEASDDKQHVRFSFTYRLASRGNAVDASSRETAYSQSAADQAEEIDYDDTQEVE